MTEIAATSGVEFAVTQGEDDNDAQSQSSSQYRTRTPLPDLATLGRSFFPTIEASEGYGRLVDVLSARHQGDGPAESAAFYAELRSCLLISLGYLSGEILLQLTPGERNAREGAYLFNGGELTDEILDE